MAAGKKKRVPRKGKIPKGEFNRKLNLYKKQEWLSNKSLELDELLISCRNSDQENLVFELLNDFNYLSHKDFSSNLNRITKYLVEESNFLDERTQLVSLTKDEKSDSGQFILYALKNSLAQAGWQNYQTANKLGASRKNFLLGYDQIVLVDEFIGSGQTLLVRLNELRNLIPGPFTLKCCFVAGMKMAIDNLSEQGVDIFCPRILNKGISDRYAGENLVKAEDAMLELELRLASRIKNKELYTYSFGWKGTEALYSLQGANGNTPNNVFPIFWWKYDLHGGKRKTLLTRAEEGF